MQFEVITAKKANIIKSGQVRFIFKKNKKYAKMVLHT